MVPKIAKKAIWHKGFSIVDNYVDNLWITQKSMWITMWITQNDHEENYDKKDNKKGS